jgi:site-specific DNA recombinase
MNLKPFPVRAALYARVSSDHQADEGTIASQVDALRQRAAVDQAAIDDELCFLDDGVSGSTLIRPQLERLRDQAAAGAFDRLYVLSPDRLARNYAYQVLLVDELRAAGVEIVFVNRELGKSPEDDLLLQVQGVIAEYERAKIIERARRGKQYAARQGQVSVLSKAPYGYRYVSKAEGGGVARFDVLLEQARVVRQVFHWVGQERLALQEVCRRLLQQQILTPTGKRCWNPKTLSFMLKNRAYIGLAEYGKSQVVPRRPRLRPRRGKPEVPRRPYSVTAASGQPLPIPVPALVGEDLFAQVAEQLAENRRRARLGAVGARHLLQGLVVCAGCGYALVGTGGKGRTAAGRQQYGYYRCSGRQVVGDDGEKVCRGRAVRSADLERSVWEDVCALLREPSRVEQEYERRLGGSGGEGSEAAAALQKRIAGVRRGISRLIDGYSEGLLEREEFEPRLRAARERLGRLEGEAKAQAEAASREADLRLVIGKLEEFGEKIESGLEEAEWGTRREVIRAMVKQIEVGDKEVRIVYRIPPVPFVERPEGGVLQDCGRRRSSFSLADASRLEKGRSSFSLADASGLYPAAHGHARLPRQEPQTIGSPSSRVRAANSSLNRRVIGPTLPSPMTRPSTFTTPANSPIVPVQNTSSARYTSVNDRSRSSCAMAFALQISSTVARVMPSGHATSRLVNTTPR